MRRNVLVPLLVLVLIAAGVAWYLRRGASGMVAEVPLAGDGSASGAAEAPAAAGERGEGGGGGAVAASGAGSADARREARAKRDALREQIARRLANRAAGPGSGPAPPPPRSPTDPRPAGNLVDNIGGRQALVDRLNHDFMPLASECIEQAQERTPRLAGLLVIGFETLADDQLGAVVDVADPTPRNQIADPLLLECLRESALSLSLPPPPASGRDKFDLSIPVEPGSDAGVPR